MATLIQGNLNGNFQGGFNFNITPVSTFKSFTSNDVITNQSKVISRGIWSGDSPTLTTFFTSSNQTDTQKTYFYQVWNANPLASGSQQQFSVAYGNRLGSGSYSVASSTDDPSKAIYSQMKVTVLNPGDTKFTFLTGSTSRNSDQIYVLTINRARIKDAIDPGNWTLNLATLSGSAVPNNVHTGSNVKVKGDDSFVSLIDDSQLTNNIVNISNASAKYNIISGSLTNGAYKDGSNNYHYYGYVYPALGLMVLNADALDNTVGFNSVTGSSVAGDNAYKLFTAISGAAAINTSYGFEARNNEKRISSTYFVRAFSTEFNYSNNPTFVTGSAGVISNTDFTSDPQTFATTIGLYSPNYELLAVAKVSRPLIKNFETEILIKVRLDY